MSSHPRKLPLTRRLFHGMRTEGAGPGRDAAAVGVGFFIGCTPLYGLHLALVFAVGWLLRLNRLKMYIAANISNPLLAPLLVLVQIQLGAWLRRGSFHGLTLQTIRTTDPWTFGLDLLIGSLVLGVVGGIAVAAATYVTSRHPGKLDDVLMSAADRYLQRGIVAWEFARGKLHGDPIYQEVLSGRLLESGPVLVDIGCGQGLMLAALAEARRRSAAGAWPADVAGPPVFEHLVGVELRPRIARLARHALDGEVIIHCADAARVEVDPALAILLFDVLHMMPADRQVSLLRSLIPRLLPGGTMLVREADAAGGSAFHLVRLGNRLKALATGNWRQQFAFRSKEDWQRLFESLGLESSVRDMREGTPFANVLFALKPRVISSGQNPRS